MDISTPVCEGEMLCIVARGSACFAVLAEAAVAHRPPTKSCQFDPFRVRLRKGNAVQFGAWLAAIRQKFPELNQSKAKRLSQATRRRDGRHLRGLSRNALLC